MSCCITFMPCGTAMLMRYSATPGIAQRTIAIAETILGCKRRRRQLRSKGFEPDGERNQDRKRRYNRLGNSARVDVVLHYLHALRDSNADAIQRDARHCAENYRDRGNHFGL